MPAIGRAVYQGGNHGFGPAARGVQGTWSGVTWSILDRPEPSATYVVPAGTPMVVRCWEITARPAAHVPAPDTTRPMVLVRISACMLLLSFRNGVSNWDRGIEECVATCRAPDGVATPVCVGPCTWTPCLPRAARNRDATSPVGSETVLHALATGPPAGMEPATRMTLVPWSRTTETVDPDPAAPVTAEFWICT